MEKHELNKSNLKVSLYLLGVQVCMEGKAIVWLFTETIVNMVAQLL